MAECPKCRFTSGDDWRQCGGSCPMPGSPHYNPNARRGESLETLERLRRKAVRQLGLLPIVGGPAVNAFAAYTLEANRLIAKQRAAVDAALLVFSSPDATPEDVAFAQSMLEEAEIPGLT